MAKTKKAGRVFDKVEPLVSIECYNCGHNFKYAQYDTHQCCDIVEGQLITYDAVCCPACLITNEC